MASFLRSVQRPICMLFTEFGWSLSLPFGLLSLGTIYLFTSLLSYIVGQLYGWNAVQAGYVQVLASSARSSEPAFPVHQPTNTLAVSKHGSPGHSLLIQSPAYPAIIGGFFGVSGGMSLVWLGRIPQYTLIVVTVGLTMVGLELPLLVSYIANYLVDAYSKHAASVLRLLFGRERSIAVSSFLLHQPCTPTSTPASTLLGFVSNTVATF